MPDVTQIVASVREELAGELRHRVRSRLREQSADWLVEQLLALVLPEGADAPVIPRQVSRGRAAPEPAVAEEGDEARARRAARLRELALSEADLPMYIQSYRVLTREVLEAEGYLIDPPHRGGPLIPAACRSERGEALLAEAKDLLYALLFGGEEEGVRLERVERELLTLTVPRAKLPALGFLMRAPTEIGAEGTWRDPERMAHDDRAANTLIQLEYGEVTGELVGNAIAAALRLINHLEINEQILYGRMENVEESTLGD